jgi:hypothetical protein
MREGPRCTDANSYHWLLVTTDGEDPCDDSLTDPVLIGKLIQMMPGFLSFFPFFFFFKDMLADLRFLDNYLV